MKGNLAWKGGCLELVSSEFDAYQTMFSENTAYQGGVIFAISQTIFQVRLSIFEKNYA